MNGSSKYTYYVIAILVLWIIATGMASCIDRPVARGGEGYILIPIANEEGVVYVHILEDHQNGKLCYFNALGGVQCYPLEGETPEPTNIPNPTDTPKPHPTDIPTEPGPSPTNTIQWELPTATRTHEPYPAPTELYP